MRISDNNFLRGLTTLVLWITAQDLVAQDSFAGLNQWYYSETVALAGAGGALTSPASDRLNPATLRGAEQAIQLSFLRYPASIGAGALSWIIPEERRTRAISIRHTNYGVFEGRDETNNPTGNYTSSETWLSVSTARTLGNSTMDWGLTGGLFLSNLASYQAVVAAFTFGGVYHLKTLGLQVGTSLRNVGWVLDSYTSAREALPTILHGSLAKRLAYLPLELVLDAEYLFSTRETVVRFGGVFTLPYHMVLRWGTSTNRLDQRGRVSLTRDFFSDTGVGLSFKAGDYQLTLGGYFYGPGGWISGFSFGVVF
jgi:hypothetical protein